MGQSHDKYGKKVLNTAFPSEYNEHPERIPFDPERKDAGTVTIDGIIGDDIAVEIESRASKQVRGALVDLLFHPRKKKLLVLIAMYNNAYTETQCRVLLKWLNKDPDCKFAVVKIKGTGNDNRRHLKSDAQIVRDAVAELRAPCKKT